MSLKQVKRWPRCNVLLPSHQYDNICNGNGNEITKLIQKLNDLAKYRSKLAPLRTPVLPQSKTTETIGIFSSNPPHTKHYHNKTYLAVDKEYLFDAQSLSPSHNNTYLTVDNEFPFDGKSSVDDVYDIFEELSIHTQDRQKKHNCSKSHGYDWHHKPRKTVVMQKLIKKIKKKKYKYRNKHETNDSRSILSYESFINNPLLK